MKTYFLRLVTDDFTKSDNTWTSGIIDFYDNFTDESELATPSYHNFSTYKSYYGVEQLGHTFIGMTVTVDGDVLYLTPQGDLVTENGILVEVPTDETVPTDLGRVDNGRFIDESGRIDVVDYTVNYTGTIGTALVNTALDLYTIDDAEAEFPNEWAFKEGIANLNTINEIASYRYGKIVLRLSSEQDISDLDVELILRIRIGEPLAGAPTHRTVSGIQKKFPEWMDFRELEDASATPQLATPQSVGGQLLNAMSGPWLDEIRDDLAYTNAQKFINLADLDQKAWIWISHNVPNQIWRITGDDVELSRCLDLKDFYELAEDEDGFWHNEVDQVLFVNSHYDDLQINYVSYDQNPHHIWNWFDEFALQMDLRRLPLESNEFLRARILDVFINRPGVGLNAFKLALRRELSLWQYWDGATPSDDPPASPDATPDSSFQGATPEVLEIKDIEEHPDFMGSDGVPTQKFRDLVEELARKYPSTWGYFHWNRATWDAGGEQGEGYGVLANRYDATPLADIASPSTNTYTQSGVGDGNDLYVFRPDEVTGAREFTGNLKLRGRTKNLRDEWRKLEFDVLIWGEAPYTQYDNPEIMNYFTLEVHLLPSATPALEHGDVYHHNFTMTARNDADAINPLGTANGYTEYQFMAEDGNALPGLVFISEDDGTEETVGTDGFTFTWDDIDYLEIKTGRWFYPTGLDVGYDPGPDNFQAFFPHLPADYLDATNYLFNSLEIDTGATPTNYPRPTRVVMLSKSISSAPGTWVSEKHRYHVAINGALPEQTTQDFTIALPDIIWYPVLTGDKTYMVEVETRESQASSTRGAFTTAADGSALFVPITTLEVNGESSWSSGVQDFDDTTTEFVFSSVDTDIYPIEAPYWDAFEADGPSFTGTVSEAGPWRNGVEPVIGNTNYNLVTMEVGRSDFGIPENDDYVVTWMGVESNNERVIIWLDSNTVHPVNDTSAVEYPDTAIQEELTDDVYTYEPFIVRARLNPNISPEWNPQVHSGWFYDREDEYYLYASPSTDYATPSYATPWVMPDVARQGAPIIVKTAEATPVDYRQVTNFDAASPSGVTMWVTQIVTGTDEARLFLGYENVHDVTVTDLVTGQSVSALTYSTTNELETVDATDKDHDYEVNYKVTRSFQADNNYIYPADHTHRTKLFWDEEYDGTPVSIVYEKSKFDPATPVDLPLSPAYTILDEGYIFISHNEYELSKVEVRLSPSSIIADGEDYLMISLRSLDVHGNPKPNVELELSSSFGTLDSTTVTTDRDGFAVTRLTSDDSTTELTGTITVSGFVDAEVTFQITPLEDRKYRLTSVPNVLSVPADGRTSVTVFGKVEDDAFAPVPRAVVYWRKGRYMEEIWTQGYSTDSASPGFSNTAGKVIADDEGLFTIGPIVAATPGSPGYWMMVMESDTSSPRTMASPTYYGYPPDSWPNTGAATPEWELVGDAVFWVEHPHHQYGVENLSGLPKSVVQLVDNTDQIPDMASPAGAYAWPTFYDEATPNADATPVTLNYEPSKWYAIDQYDQYQMGMLGPDREPTTPSYFSGAHPHYRKF